RYWSLEVFKKTLHYAFSAAKRLRSTSCSSGTANSWLSFASLHILANNYLPLNEALPLEILTRFCPKTF
ncbi:hypothetical protein, partial [Paraferrimonas sp. SM1919]|uniref:hypothetical protein n=1 Tax=Paraferrimonas sp. SM1919 TaxID=2662263 RepID=UPI001969F61F